MAKKPKHRPIPQVEVPADEDKLIRFSFKHLDTSNPKFNPSQCCTEYFCRMLHTLRRFSTWTVGYFTDQNNNERRHIIDFGMTSEPDGFQNVPAFDRDQLGYVEGWQFSVYPERAWSDWRAHGILIDDIFYVIWLDPDHRLYPKG